MMPQLELCLSWSDIYSGYRPERFTQRSLDLRWHDRHGGVPPYDRGDAHLSYRTRSIRSYATRIIEDGYLRQDCRTQVLTKYLRRMCYDDAIYMLEWRLELLYLSSGQPHFRLYRKGCTFGVAGIATSHADLGNSRTLSEVREMLAAYLVFWDWDVRDVWMVRGGALTSLDANTDHQYRLFKTAAPRKRDVSYDLLRDERMMA